MKDEETTISQCECLRCGHKWIPRKPGRPACCPRCKSYVYDEPPAEGDPAD